MRLATKEQSQTIDQRAISELGFSAEELMENAGQAFVSEFENAVKDRKKKILILVGPGNNGADGLVISRLLKRKGYNFVRCVLVEKSKSSELWVRQMEKAKVSQVEILDWPLEQTYMLLSDCDVVVDAIYGTGLSRKLTPELSSLIKFLNLKKKFVIAVDVPTGLDANRGWPLGAAVKSSLTVTFGLPKPGFYLAKGPMYAGRIKWNQIGFPDQLINEVAITHFAFAKNSAQKLLPKKGILANKASTLPVHFLVGSETYPGAGILCSKSALRVGVGFGYIYSKDQSCLNILKLPEAIFRKMDKNTIKSIPKKDVVILGSGLGAESMMENWIADLKKGDYKNVILDGDALRVAAEKSLYPFPESWILTPHAGELGRFFDLHNKSKEIQKDRLQWAKRAQEKLGGTIVLKGPKTIVVNSKCSFIILSGNASLAKAGTGDVLAGIIAGFLGQTQNTLKATCLGTYVHGAVADQWIKQGKDILSLLPSDIIEELPTFLNDLRKGSHLGL